ncbi:S9 family peptidase, partial [Sphingomonas sp. PAMC 26617]|uniref:S9 family peptidase n=1 Tax=Sphingomonas sp. PAMC 26617 TaxID=1112216 RepID=UPI00028A131D
EPEDVPVLNAKTLALVMVLLAVGTSEPATARPAPFTIEQVMQAPYPTSLAAAPRGDQAAWVYNIRGVRNIWVADAKKPGSAHALTAYIADDGFDLGELTWSPDVCNIAFTRGQTLEDDGPANVTSAATGPSPREVWSVATSGGTARRLGYGHDPSFSPDGALLMFLDKRTIMEVALGGDGKASPLLVDEGTIRSAKWSPDGKRVAFASQRGGHALIGVLEHDSGLVTWMAPGFDLDSSPVFSPDGLKVAFIRQQTQSPHPFTAQREGPPWSIWIGDVRTGSARRVWVADAGSGSVYHATLSSQNLMWSTDGLLIFPWEKTGWVMPYAVRTDGGAARALTSGGSETAFMTLTPNGRDLVFASNRNDPERLHIWKVNTARGVAAPLAYGDGIEAYPVVSPNGTVFVLRSGARSQLAPAFLKADHWMSLAPAAAARSDFPTDQLVAPQAVAFAAPDGAKVHGQIFLPEDKSDSKRPAILFFHGGPSRQMLLGFHYMGAYSWMYGLNEYFAAKGFVVLSVNYRGGIGYGLKYREAMEFGPRGGSETNDIVAALDYLRARGDVDLARVGIWGGSYGGLMTALGLARASDRIAVGVDYAGVYDWTSMLATLGAPIEDLTERALSTASSPVATIAKWHSPVLVVHADDDRNVPFQQSTELVQDLRMHGIEHDELVLPDEVHDLTRYASWLRLFHATDNYLSRHLLKTKNASGS